MYGMKNESALAPLAQDPAQFRESLRAVLKNRTPHREDRLNLVCAAVLVPILFKEEEWHVLVTQRTEHVEHHKGQISFPGGACDVQDADLEATALRETFEEIGIPPDEVEILGVLDDVPTVTNFAVTPFVAVIPHPFDYRLNGHEVEAVIEVPLSFLLDTDHLRVAEREHQGRIYQVLVWDYGPFAIWGATAQILKGLLELLN